VLLSLDLDRCGHSVQRAVAALEEQDEERVGRVAALVLVGSQIEVRRMAARS
jgi:hypothetical protein